MPDWTRGDDPIYNGLRQHWPKSVDIEENQVVVDKAAWESTIEANEKYFALGTPEEFAALICEKAARDNPQPLTLEQLKERVGQPVWISGLNRWGIIGRKGVDADDDANPIFRYVVGFAFGWEWVEDVLCGKRVAYDRPPKEART